MNSHQLSNASLAEDVPLQTEPDNQILIDADTIRQMVQHEAEQVNRRLTWMCTIHGFLSAAVAFIWGQNSAYYVVRGLCIASLAVSVLVFVGLVLGSCALYELIDWWRIRKAETGYKGPPVTSLWREEKPWAVFLSFDNMLALVFVAGWAILLQWLIRFPDIMGPK
jgi:hypothetical protein